MYNKVKFIVIVVIMGIVLFSAVGVYAGGGRAARSGANTAANIAPVDKDATAVADGIFKFSFNLYGKIKDLPAVKSAEGNLFFSPYSISSALAMTYTGARGNTAKEMASTLCLPAGEVEQIAAGYGSLQKQLQADPKTSGYQLNIANALWGQKGYGFLPAFLDLNKKYFGSGLTELDFAQSEAARKTINTWVEQQTKDKIKDLIPSGSIDAMTRLVLTNAIYFKGDWAIKFKTEDTKPAKFNVTADKAVEVQMMYQKETFEYGESDKVQILQMPYKGNQLTMMIILPKGGVSIEDIDKQLVENPSSVISSASRRKVELDVYLPKFKMTCGTLELNKILAAMGMKEAFTDSADFSGMSGRKDLCISNVMHKAFIEVNEEGTEAAAATAVGMRLTAMPLAPPVFRADRPFIFIIKENAGAQTILFMGRVCNPTLQ
jgi:serpin B